MRTDDDYALRQANKAFDRDSLDDDPLGDVATFVIFGAALIWFFANY